MSQRFGDDELRAAYVGGGDPADAHGAECPTPDALLAAVRGEGGAGREAERLDVLDRALRCAACRRELALLHAVTEPPQRMAPAVRGRAWVRVVPLAAAASVVLAVGLFGVDRWRRGGEEVTRAAGGDPALVAPAPAAPVDADSVTFAWRPVAGAFGYTLEVDATDGTVLHSAQTADTVLVVRLGSAPPGEHRWSVRARLGDGTERRSESRPLRLRR